jgi:GNAT superfamily N-acetyltransferase
VPWSIEPLTTDHVRSTFHCGEPQLDSFLSRHALANEAAGLGRTFVAVATGSRDVLGYFTMAAGSVRFDNVPDHVKRRLPKYPIPTAHLAKLGVDHREQGKGLGAALLVAALQRAAHAAQSVGVYAVDVFALHDKAKAFYLKYGFVPLLDNPLHLYMPIAAAKAVAGIVGAP